MGNKKWTHQTQVENPLTFVVVS